MFQQQTKLIDNVSQMMADMKMGQGDNQQQIKRTSIQDQGQISNYRKMQREAMRLATQDIKQNIPPQIWYDSLRETDDGRYSESNIFQNDLKHNKNMNNSRKDYLKRKVLNHVSKND